MNTAQKSSLKALVAAALALALTGCMTSGKFSCKAPDGVSCMSTPELYEMTNNYGGGAFSGSQQAEEAPVKRSKRGNSGKVANHQVGATGDALALSAPTQLQLGAVREAALSLGTPAANEETPIGGSESVARVPAKVMRIWVAPWTDGSGDLHMPGYVFSEITTRRWSIGGDVRSSANDPSSFDPNGPWMTQGASKAITN